MKKITLLFLCLTLLPFIGVQAQQNNYSMVIEMNNGSKITIGPNDVKNVVFNDGKLVVTGVELQTWLSNMSATIDSYNNKIATLESNLSSVNSDISANATKVSSLETSVSSLSSDIASTKTKVGTLQTEVGAWQTYFDSWSTNLEVMRANLVNVNNRLTTLNNNYSSISKDVASFASRIEELIARIEALENESTPSIKISVTTGTAENITYNGVTISNSSFSGLSESLSVGIIYGTSSTLSESSSTMKSTTSNGTYSITLSGLSAETTYYYRAYAVYDGKYYYGDIKNFETNATPAVSFDVTTSSTTSIGETSAMLNGSITANNTTKSYTAGFFLTTTGTPSSGNYTKNVTGGTNTTGTYSAQVSGLTGNTKYYVRAYVLYDDNYYYGVTTSFTTTKPTTGTLNGHNWVDLGLPSGTRWATCNIGASSTTGYGNYYAWGETETKTSYSKNTYQYYIIGNWVNIGDDISGTKYDVAHVKWGSSWVLPSKSQIDELVDNCTSVWTTQNGVWGRKFTSNINSVTIFFPAGGWYADATHYKAGEAGCYMSSSVSQGLSGMLNYQLSISENSASCASMDRARGYMVRPVCK